MKVSELTIGMADRKITSPNILKSWVSVNHAWPNTAMISVKFCVVGMFLLLVILPTSWALEVPFSSRKTIDGNFNINSMHAADVDVDGDTDLIGAAHEADEIAWWENSAGNGSAWTKHIVDDSFDADIIYAADVDGDGDTDVLGSGYFADEIDWWENTAGNGSAWIKHTVDDSVDADIIYAADVDGDGDTDVLGTEYHDGIDWWENTAGNGSAWIKHTVDDSVDADIIYAADVDGDGDTDVLGTEYHNDGIDWWENTAGNGSAWTKHTVFDGAYVNNVYAADVDGDGDTDLIGVLGTSVFYVDEIVWWENTAGNGSAWTKHTVDDKFSGAESVCAADMDGDGDRDLIGAASDADEIAWWKNTAGNGSVWEKHSIDPSFKSAQIVYTADVDGDGDMDVLGAAWSSFNGSIYNEALALWENNLIGASPILIKEFSLDNITSIYAADVDSDGDIDMFSAASDADEIAWWENTAENASVWAKHTVVNSFDGVNSVYATDLDGDGDTDVLGAASYADEIAWWENTAGNGSAWTKHTFDGSFDFARSVYAADVDGDGDTDVLGSSADEIAWWENTAGNGSAWTKHTVVGSFDGCSENIYAADVDGDGDTDVLGTYGSYFNEIAWWENTAGNGSAWIMHTIQDWSLFEVFEAIYAADMDGDGDTDVLGAPGCYSEMEKGGNKIVWWENTAGNGSAWINHTICNSFDGVFSTYAEDMDGDGDTDVLGAASLDDEIAWWENTDGKGFAWTKQTVDDNFDGARSVLTADVDGDGFTDIIGAASDADRISCWIAVPGQFDITTSKTSQQFISEGKEDDVLKLVFTHTGKAGDVDSELSEIELLLEESPGAPINSVQADAIFESISVYIDADSNGQFSVVDKPVLIQSTFSLTDGKLILKLNHYDENVKVSYGSPKTFFIVPKLASDAYFQTPDQFHITFLSAKAKYRDYDIELYHSHKNRFTPVPTGIIQIGDSTPPVIMGLADSDVPANNKEWIWTATDAQTGISFRYAVDQKPYTDMNTLWTPSTGFDPGASATQNSGNGIYYLHVQAADPSGNESGIKTVYGIMDNTLPAAPTVSGPDLTNDPTPQWTWTSNGDGGDGYGTSSFYRYKLDEPWLETGASTSYMTFFIPAANLGDGPHTLYVQERDIAGNWSLSGSKAVTIDLSPPNTPTVSLSGAAVRNTQTATWTWTNTGSGGNGTFRYKLDDSNLTVGATETILTTCTFSSLSDGIHVLYVQERDAVGNWSLYSSASVTVDTEAPNPPFVWNSTPLTNDPRPKWQWTPGGGGNGTFEYVLKKGAQTVLSGTVKAVSFVPGSDLADGVYTLSVREQDLAGNVSEYDSSDLEVDRTAGWAPVITEAVTPTKINPPTWKWRTNGGTGLFRYKLDPQSNENPQMDTGATETYADWFRPSGILPDGDHFLFVQERDTAGNWSPPSMGIIEVDTGKPCSCAASESFVLVAAGGIGIEYEFDEVYAGEPCINTDSETETSGSGIVKVELYVKKPGDIGFSLTAADAEGSIDGIFHYTVPGNAPGVYEFYTLAYDRAGNMENLSSACVTRTVFSTEFAGYGLIITGSVSDEEGLESHTKTGGRVWQHLKNRNFLVSDTGGNHWDNTLDHVKFFSPYDDAPITGKDDYSVNPENGLPCSYKEAVEHAITEWAPQRINEIEGPLWIVMLDHGSEDTFYLNGFEQIKPGPLTESEELKNMNDWLAALEKKIPADYYSKPENFIAVVIGACHSGSFIDDLSAPGRIIISSAAADEVSYRGPRVPGLYRDGEFFVSALFNELGKGSDLHTSYTRAVELTENHTDSGLSDKRFPYFDTARQHPYMDDDGDPGSGPVYWGSHTLRSGGDGDLCKLTDLGYGEETVPLEVTAAGRAEDVLSPSRHSNLLWAGTNFAGDPKNIRVWVEIREPGVILAETGTGEDTSRIVDMIPGTLEWNSAAGRYETTYTGFDLPGRYTLFFYAMGTDELISHPRRTYVYKSLANSQPGAFSLLSPANGERVPLTFLADWSDATDPDGDAVTYTVTVSEKADFSITAIEKTGLLYSHAILSKTDGIADGKTYHWKVTAGDGNGGISESAVRSFTADSTVNPTDIIAEGNVYDAVTGLPVPGADIIYGTAVLKCDASGGYAKVLPYQENYTVTVSAAGYSTESFSIGNIKEGDPVRENFGLYSLSNPGTGNIDCQNGVTLADAVLVLKILTGTDTGDAVILKQSAVNGNSVIGPADAVFILQTVAEMRE
ncbi:MAG: FG-GAP-like repeat-containing protein [Desulfococcaceae bacterium]